MQPVGMALLAAGCEQRLNPWSHGQRVIIEGRRTQSTSSLRMPEWYTRSDRRRRSPGPHSTPRSSSFVQDEALSLRGQLFSVLLAGIVGLFVGNTEGRLER
jgi:hypothetical protein